MNRTLLCAAALFALPLSACLATHSTEALEVDASIASVTLGEDCGMGAGLIGGERCDSEGPCPSLCQQSSVQLRLVAGAEGAEVPFEIVSIRVIDPESGSATSITARNPRVFVDGYAAWDETIAPAESLSVSYETTSPSWGALGGGADSFGWGHVYRVEMVVRIDGVERTLRADAMREPEIAT